MSRHHLSRSSCRMVPRLESLDDRLNPVILGFRSPLNFNAFNLLSLASLTTGQNVASTTTQNVTPPIFTAANLFTSQRNFPSPANAAFNTPSSTFLVPNNNFTTPSAVSLPIPSRFSVPLIFSSTPATSAQAPLSTSAVPSVISSTPSVFSRTPTTNATAPTSTPNTQTSVFNSPNNVGPTPNIFFNSVANSAASGPFGTFFNVPRFTFSPFQSTFFTPSNLF